VACKKRGFIWFYSIYIYVNMGYGSYIYIYIYIDMAHIPQIWDIKWI
jgi:hypothetical protein